MFKVAVPLLHVSCIADAERFYCEQLGFVDDVDALHREFLSRDVFIDLPPIDQTWGSREMYVKDADRNCLRFMQL